MDAIATIDRMTKLKPGQSIVYHVGDLAPDSFHNVGVRRLAHAAWCLYQAGAIHLTQRRLGFLQYEYIATATR